MYTLAVVFDETGTPLYHTVVSAADRRAVKEAAWLDVSQRGSIFGLTLDTDRTEIVKELLEGICYEVKINVESLENAGISIHSFRAIGAGRE